MSNDVPIIRAQRPVSDSELKQLLDAANSGGETDNFFEQFHYYSTDDPRTLIFGEALLSRCQNLAPDIYKKLHKGTPFYWLSRAAFLVHDYETAVFYIDAAVSEDLKEGAPIRDTPALSFFQIDTNNLNQASHGLVTHLRKTIDTALVSYNARPDANQLTFPEVQTCLLRAALAAGNEDLRTLATTFISFFLEWQHLSRLIELRTEPGTAEPFYIHLFKGCVLFESLLKRGNTEKTTLGALLIKHWAELGFASKPKMNVSNFDFPTVVEDIPKDGTSIFTAVERTGRIRNTTGHNLGWLVALSRQDYDVLAGYVASSCLHAIACLYR